MKDEIRKEHESYGMISLVDRINSKQIQELDFDPKKENNHE